tara:strand:+ start:253 stop:402 length:150 start_codon:yes stop_codon:yes gene_type:complete
MDDEPSNSHLVVISKLLSKALVLSIAVVSLIRYASDFSQPTLFRILKTV